MKANPGSQRLNPSVTIFDIAKAVGVHASTVSRAFDPKQQHRVRKDTRERIHRRADEMGYRMDYVARGLRQGRTATIGVVAPDLASTYTTPIIYGLTAAVESTGMLPLIAETNEDSDRLQRVINHMLSRRVDALVVAAGRESDRALLESAAQAVPLVVAARPLRGTELPQVIHNENLGGRMVAEHLHGLGHECAVQLPGPAAVGNFRRRRAGFSQSWQRRKLEEIGPPEPSSRATIEEGVRMMQETLASGEGFSAVFAHNDLVAIGAMWALREAGIQVPEEVSLVGYNDLPTVAYFTPPLTTVRTKTFELGYRAGELVKNLLAGESVENVVLEPELMVRASTAARASASSPRSAP